RNIYTTFGTTVQAPITNNSISNSSGGLIVTEYDTCAANQANPLTVAELNPATGQPTWQVQAAGVWNGAQIVYCYGNGDAPEIATRNDGAVIISEPTNNGFPRLTLVQPNGGVELFSIPDSTSTVNGSQISVQCCMGPPMANETGWRMSNMRFGTSEILVLHRTICICSRLTQITRRAALF